MQMSRMYCSTSKLKQAHEYRLAADECEAAGLLGFARVNREMAAWLDPWFGRDEEQS